MSQEYLHKYAPRIFGKALVVLLKQHAGKGLVIEAPITHDDEKFIVVYTGGYNHKISIYQYFGQGEDGEFIDINLPVEDDELDD